MGSTPDPDLDLLRRVAAGDGDAFTPFVERHQERIARVCARMLGNPEDGRDAAQEAFLKAYRGAGSFRPEGQVFTWLYRIAVNHCLNRLRRQRLVRFLPLFGPATADGAGEGDALYFDPPDPAPGPAAEAEAAERRRELERAIARLPAGQRAVLVLAKLEGLSYREIATSLGITEGAVESRLVRAMRTLTREAGAPGQLVASQESGSRRVS